MGSCIGGFSPNSTKPGQGDNIYRISQDLGYSKGDIGIMYRFFNSMDVYDTGIVSVRAFCAIYKISDAFGNLIFRKMNGSKKSDMDFEEFLISSWNMLSFFDQNDLAIFTFELFDTDASGILSPSETKHMVHIIWGDNAKKNVQVVHALNSHMGKKRSVHVSGFITLTKDFPILLFPVFELLRISRKNTLGEFRWKELSHRRKASASAGGPRYFGDLKHISGRPKNKVIREDEKKEIDENDVFLNLSRKVD